MPLSSAPARKVYSKRSWQAALTLACAFALAACSMGGNRRLSQQEKDDFLGAPTSPVESQPLGGPAASGDQIGTGPVRVGLIVPLTQGTSPSVVGASLRNAAELAVTESGANDITVLVKDDHSTPDGARTAAQAAVGEGAEILIGPL